MKSILLLLALPSIAVASWSGKSTADFHPAAHNRPAELVTDNTEFRFDQYLLNAGPKMEPQQQVRLYEIHKSEKVTSGVDAEYPNLIATAIDPATNRRLWSLEGEYDAFTAHGNYFVASTSRGGDCATNYKLFSATTGKRLADYSFRLSKSGLPLILRADAFRPDGFRFLAYHDSYWPCGKSPKWQNPPKGLQFAGVLTYASPERVIQKLAVFFVDNDPSQEPDSLDLVFGGKTKSFTNKSDSPFEYEYWWREGGSTLKPGDAPAKIFNGVSVNIHWGDDVLSIPLEADRLAVGKAKAGKRYQVIKEIPEKDWDQY